MDNKKKSGLAIMIAMGKKPKNEEEMPPDDEMMGSEPQSTKGESEGGEGLQYIKPPKGFEPPPDKQSGESFTGTYRAHMTDDGRLCFDSINNIPMHSEDTETEGDEESESPEEQENEEKMGLEKHKTPDESEGQGEADDEGTARAKFNKIFRGGR